MSKSGLFAHFGSKEELQVATIEMARAEFTEQVIEPASVAPTGLERVRRLSRATCDYVEGGVYPGGCFFASVAAEMALRPGRYVTVRLRSWTNFRGNSRRPSATPKPRARSILQRIAEQLAFELGAYLSLANAQFAVSQESAPIDRARRALDCRLTAAATSA